MTRLSEWAIPGRIWAILAAWGVGILVLAALFAYRIDSVQREQDRAMCVMLDLFTAGPAPVAGPAGDRGRAVLAAMRVYRATLRCQD